MRDFVQVAFEREDALRRAEAAKGSVRRHVRRNGATLDANVRAKVWPGGVNRSARQHDRRERGVSSAVNDEIYLHAEQFSFARDSRAMLRPGRMALGRGRHVFRAVVNNLDGSTGFPGEEGRVPRDHRRIFFLAAEAAARLDLHDANFVFRQIEQFQQRLVNIIRALHRTPDSHAVCGAGNRNHAVVLDVELLLRARAIFAFDDEIGAVPRLRPHFPFRRGKT